MSADRAVLSGLEDAARDLVRQLTGGRALAALKKRLAQLERGRGGEGPDAEVITAVPLTAAECEELGSRLRARFGAELPIAYRVDPAILGGVVVRVGDRLVDGSVVSRIGQLRETLVGSRTAGRR